MEIGGNAIGGGGRDCGKIARQPFPYMCSDGSRTLRLLCTYITLICFLGLNAVGVMFVHIRRSVREQPDT